MIICGKCSHGPIPYDRFEDDGSPECPKCGADLIAHAVTSEELAARVAEVDKGLSELCGDSDSPLRCGQCGFFNAHDSGCPNAEPEEL